MFHNVASMRRLPHNHEGTPPNKHELTARCPVWRPRLQEGGRARVRMAGMTPIPAPQPTPICAPFVRMRVALGAPRWAPAWVPIRA
jgi:hypothetical protein